MVAIVFFKILDHKLFNIIFDDISEALVMVHDQAWSKVNFFNLAMVVLVLVWRREVVYNTRNGSSAMALQLWRNGIRVKVDQADDGEIRVHPLQISRLAD